MSIKKIELNISGYYLLSWNFGIIGLICLYFNHWIISVIMFILCYSYSVKDYQNQIFDKPPDDTIKPAL